MNIASVYDCFARDSMCVALQTNDPRQREIFLTLALLWAGAARQRRDEATTARHPSSELIEVRI
jgi:hypothetical protein